MHRPLFQRFAHMIPTLTTYDSMQSPPPPPPLSPTSSVLSPLSPPLATPIFEGSDHFLRRTRRFSSSSSSSAAVDVGCLPPDRSKINVLLVDDNHVNLQVLARILKIHMADTVHHLDFAKSGVKALDLLNRARYDLVLLDIDMPVLNGVETARQIRNASKEYTILNQNRNVPIVAVTTNDTSDWKRAYAQVGMNGCVSKPVVPSVLKETLFQVLNTGYSPESLAIH
ncbi:CheY-like superfamily [Dichotomocladium elegans]|nr:CheY-like superfamily [Dichotomocladium elegans]